MRGGRASQVDEIEPDFFLYGGVGAGLIWLPGSHVSHFQRLNPGRLKRGRQRLAPVIGPGQIADLEVGRCCGQ